MASGPLEVLLGSPGLQVLLTRSGSGKNGGRKKGEDCNKVFPSGLSSRERGGATVGSRAQRAGEGVSRSRKVVFYFLGRW